MRCGDQNRSVVRWEQAHSLNVLKQYLDAIPHHKNVGQNRGIIKCSVTVIPDGTTIFVYLSSRTRVKGATFVPVIGLFAGGAKSHLSTKTFTFDGAGLLKTYTSSDADANCNTSIVGARCE